MEYPKASQVASGLEFLAETGSTNQDLAALAKKVTCQSFIPWSQIFKVLDEADSIESGRPLPQAR